MKRILLLLTLGCNILAIGQNEQIQIVKSEIKKVKLFMTSGEMLHEQTLKLTKGRNKLIFSGISAFANPQSIQFFAQVPIRLVSVSTEMDFLAAEQFNPKIAILKDSMEILKDKKQFFSDQIIAYQSENEVLEANKQLGGKNQNLTVAQIRDAADFYRVRTLEIQKQLSKLKKAQQEAESQIEKIRFQLVELNYKENQRSNQVIILVDVNETISAFTTLKYLVSDCGWAANYDLTAKDLNQKINLKYKAQVYNNTGRDWTNVDLTLSTGDPRLSASHPEMDPWYLYYSDKEKYKYKNSYYTPQVVQEDFRQIAQDNINIANKRVYDNYVLEENATKFETQKKAEYQQQVSVNSGGVSMRQIEISQLMAEFSIQNKFSCPSDSKPYMVDVKEMELDAHFSHITVPKLDHAAFVLANIVGWQDLELVPGPANVFFGGQYVGLSEIDTKNISDTMALSFGRDTKITVIRKLKKEMSSKKVMGSTKKDAYVYEIVLRNNRDIAVKIDVFDQIPISKTSEVTVSVDQVEGANMDIETGETKWELTLQPGEVKVVEIGYTIKYPKNANISVVKFRTISSPSF